MLRKVYIGLNCRAFAKSTSEILLIDPVKITLLCLKSILYIASKLGHNSGYAVI